MKFVSKSFVTSAITFVAYFQVYLNNNIDSTIKPVMEDKTILDNKPVKEDRTILDNIHTHVVS